MEQEESKKLSQISIKSKISGSGDIEVSPQKNLFLALPVQQVGNNGHNQISDSDVSFWDSDCPEEL